MHDMEKLAYRVVVVMEKVPTANRWQTVRWQIAAVLPDEGHYQSPTAIESAPGSTKIAHPGFELGIFRDEGEGYFLNIHAPEPSIFATWRWNADETEAIPHAVTLSYNEAARWMDAQESVERVPMPAALHETLSVWVEANYKPPEKKQRIRPKSFESKEGRYKGGM
jgi:Protein of unknown function (DUF3305)